MKKMILKQTTMIALLLTGLGGMLVTQMEVQAQQTNYQAANGQVTVKGTSTLHDWEMKSATGQTKAAFTLSDHKISAINALSFTVAAESLKSDKNGLDKNAYRALNTDKHKQITFTMTSGTVTASGNNKVRVTATGNLNISGSSKRTTLTAEGVYNPSDRSITVKGSTKFNMSEYGVKPPVLMMGTIKTGDEITIDYQVKLTAN